MVPSHLLLLLNPFLRDVSGRNGLDGGARGDLHGDSLRELSELRALGDEVSLTVDLNHDAKLGT